jgi:hypothetical protein
MELIVPVCTAELMFEFMPLKPFALVAVVAVAALPVHEPDEPVVFWLNVGQVNVPVLKLPD